MNLHCAEVLSIPSHASAGKLLNLLCWRIKTLHRVFSRRWQTSQVAAAWWKTLVCRDEEVINPTTSLISELVWLQIITVSLKTSYRALLPQ